MQSSQKYSKRVNSSQPHPIIKCPLRATNKQKRQFFDILPRVSLEDSQIKNVSQHNALEDGDKSHHGNVAVRKLPPQLNDSATARPVPPILVRLAPDKDRYKGVALSGT